MHDFTGRRAKGTLSAAPVLLLEQGYGRCNMHAAFVKVKRQGSVLEKLSSIKETRKTAQISAQFSVFLL